ncbi:sugar phosphate isomerase/epimerase and 4-hydroxyphenylpyruvate domain-containing protein [Piscinibacter sp. XHJ-5]|uniref:bifunctional sugar phosphate isomerase/epimerase/4-hydroxyphenylpyruvate dioxygenase family protein n=1 Tax=Piscinibacter sp. XHJ-5 TaxID=3037797 RepID=UPI002452B98A|nr:sugar phosphate isomerase/epimerase and 4-hydroxyphenylpyruvate domain-containing protein [Piscinibacter sp. XHJ-5]
MRRSIATVSLSGTLPQKLEAIAAAGFDGIELFEPDFTLWSGSAAELRQRCADLGLAIELFQPFRDFEGMPDAQFARSLERAERKFDLMQALDCSLMLVCSNVSPLALDDGERAAAQLHELAQRAGRRGLRVGFEALAWGRHVKRWRQAWHIVERAKHPQLGLILDSFHTLSLQDDLSSLAEVPGERIFFVQMADAPLMRLDVIDWARHHRNFPGQGQLDVVGFFEHVVRAGYRGPLSLEIFNDVFRETPNRRIAVDAMRSLLWLESQVHDRLQSEPKAAALFSPPSVPSLAGFSFIEFAVDAPAAEGLGRLLQGLGFRLAGRHRSKPVMLYRQGGINIVVNLLAHEAARTRFEAHGPSVCAWGLRAADPTAAMERATALQSARFDSPTGPGERQLPSIVAPGGIIVHFIDEALGANGLYEADFVLDEAPPAGDAGLRNIDHVAMGLAPDRVDTWVLFCRAVLGLQSGDSLKLADPYGLIRSFGMADSARRVRLVLNVSQSQRTRTAQTVNASGGAVVHHIAFDTADIFAAVRRMREQGVAFVPISANYHDDLATRFDLDAGLVERLRTGGILFDRTSEGDYLHAYTEPFMDRFFFEIVQRVGNYDAYGALNAAARMAAQADVS